MKSFRQYLLEQNTEASDHPHFVSSNTDGEITTHKYQDENTGVQSYIHTRDDTAYWGITIPKDNDGPSSARMHTAFDHLADFTKRNPSVLKILFLDKSDE